MARSTPGTSASKGSAQTIPNRGFRPPPISRPMPRPPMRPTYGSGATNFYRRPSYSYGVPTGLGALLSGQQSPFGRMVDPATGFPQRSSPRPVMGRPDFGQIGRSTSSGKSGSKGGAKTVRTPDQGRETNRQPQPDIGMTPFPGGYDDDRTRSSQIPRDILDRGTVMNPVYRSQGPESLMGRDVPPIYTQGLPERPDLIPARSARPVSQTPEEAMRQRILAGNRRGTGLDSPPAANPLTPPRLTVQQRTGFSGAMEQAPSGSFPPPSITSNTNFRLDNVLAQQPKPPTPVVMPSSAPSPPVQQTNNKQRRIAQMMQMGQTGGRPNIRPTMNVGKATGGPVGIHSGIASLVGRR